MSFKDLEIVFDIIENIKVSDDFSRQKDEGLICLAEETLNLKFPPTYRNFLNRYGCRGVRGIEIYGIVDSDFENSGIPDAIWFTLEERKSSNLPEHVILISPVGNGEYYAIDCSCVDKHGESPIVVFYPWDAKDIKKFEKVADDFGQFLKGPVLRKLHFGATRMFLLF